MTPRPTAPELMKKQALGLQASANATRSAIVQMLSLATSAIDRIVLTAILIRVWGTEGFASWTTVVAVTGLVAVIELGFQQLVGNQLLRSFVKNRVATFNDTLAWSLFTSILLGLIALAMLPIIAATLDLRAIFGLRSEQYVWALLIMAAYSIVRMARGPLLQIYRGVGEFYNFVWADVRAMIASVLLAVVAVFLGHGPIEVAIIYLVTTLLLSVVWTWYDLARRFPFIRFAIRRPPAEVVRNTMLAMRWYALYFVLTTVMQGAPIIILAVAGFPATLLVTLAVQRTLVNFVRTTSLGLSTAAGAELSLLKLSGKTQAFERGLLAIGRLNACLAAFAVVGLLVFGERIVQFWTGQADLGSSTILALLLIPAVVVAPAVGLQLSSVMLDRVKDQAIGYTLYAIVGLGGGLLLLPHYGVVGIAAAIAVGETLAIGLYAPILAARQFGISYLRIVSHTAMVFAAICGWAGLIAVGVGILPIPWHDWRGLVPIFLWVAIAVPPAIWLCAPAALRRTMTERVFRTA